MARAARWVHWLIFSMVALLLNREPEAWYQEPGFQPSAVMHPDDSHRDPIVTVEDTRPQVEQAPPPVAVPFTPNQFPDPATSARIYRRNSQFYNIQSDQTPVIWHAAEQAKKAAQTAAASSA